MTLNKIVSMKWFPIGHWNGKTTTENVLGIIVIKAADGNKAFIGKAVRPKPDHWSEIADANQIVAFGCRIRKNDVKALAKLLAKEDAGSHSGQRESGAWP